MGGRTDRGQREDINAFSIGASTYDSVLNVQFMQIGTEPATRHCAFWYIDQGQRVVVLKHSLEGAWHEPSTADGRTGGRSLIVLMGLVLLAMMSSRAKAQTAWNIDGTFALLSGRTTGPGTDDAGLVLSDGRIEFYNAEIANFQPLTDRGSALVVYRTPMPDSPLEKKAEGTLFAEDPRLSPNGHPIDYSQFLDIVALKVDTPDYAGHVVGLAYSLKLSSIGVDGTLELFLPCVLVDTEVAARNEIVAITSAWAGKVPNTSARGPLDANPSPENVDSAPQTDWDVIARCGAGCDRTRTTDYLNAQDRANTGSRHCNWEGVYGVGGGCAAGAAFCSIWGGLQLAPICCTLGGLGGGLAVWAECYGNVIDVLRDDRRAADRHYKDCLAGCGISHD